MPFAYVIPVPVRNIHHYIAFHNRLASQARIQLKIRRLLHAIHLVILHLRQVFHPLLHHHMAGRARAASAAGMLQMKTEIHRHIQQRAGTPVVLIRQLAGLEFESLSGGEKSYLGHLPIVAGRI